MAEPGEDMIGMLIREHGDDLSIDELVGIASLLLIAGHETTSNMLGLGTLALLRHPEQLAMVRDDPAMVTPAVEELLRWLSIVHSGIPRTTTTEVEIAGQTIPEGELLVVALPAANRDPALHRGPGTAGHHPRCARPRRIRPRGAPLPRGAARPDGDAHRLPGAAPALPEPRTGRA